MAKANNDFIPGNSSVFAEEYAKQKARKGWQPIKTAPQDGTEILMRFLNPHRGKNCYEYGIVRWAGFWKVEGLNLWCGDIPWDAEISTGLKATHWRML